MPHAHFGQARLAPAAQDHGQTRHACRRTSGGDRKPEIVNIKAAQDHKIGHASVRSEICSRIVAAVLPCPLKPLIGLWSGGSRERSVEMSTFTAAFIALLLVG